MVTLLLTVFLLTSNEFCGRQETPSLLFKVPIAIFPKIL